MQPWIALVILQTSVLPLTNSLPPDPAASGSALIEPAQHASPPGFVLGRMTGFEADTYVNVPTSTKIGFDNEGLCSAAKTALAQAYGVASVTCIRVTE